MVVEVEEESGGEEAASAGSNDSQSRLPPATKSDEPVLVQRHESRTTPPSGVNDTRAIQRHSIANVFKDFKHTGTRHAGCRHSHQHYLSPVSYHDRK
jgi:hypothetical protein